MGDRNAEWMRGRGGEMVVVYETGRGDASIEIQWISWTHRSMMEEIFWEIRLDDLRFASTVRCSWPYLKSPLTAVTFLSLRFPTLSGISRRPPSPSPSARFVSIETWCASSRPRQIHF